MCLPCAGNIGPLSATVVPSARSFLKKNPHRLSSCSAAPCHMNQRKMCFYSGTFFKEQKPKAGLHTDAQYLSTAFWIFS